MLDSELPRPDELGEFPISYQAKAIYALLWEHRSSPLTMQEIRERLGELGRQEQLDRRRRELNRYFVIERAGQTSKTRYRLIRRKPRSPGADDGISERDRAAVLRHGRCAMCGRAPLEHGVVLQVDHKLPKEWGGTDDPENLQPLCEACNRGKKNLFASYEDFGDEIRGAIGYESVHMRIGEFLKALGGRAVRSDILGVVASPPGDYQEDWQKRLRELRVLGWRIETNRRLEDGRTRSFYRLLEAPPWPEGNIRTEIRRREHRRGS